MVSSPGVCKALVLLVLGGASSPAHALPATVRALALSPDDAEARAACTACVAMMTEAKEVWESDQIGKTAAAKLAAFRTDLKDVFHKKCKAALHDVAECNHCEECAAQATEADMDAFLETDNRVLCDRMTGANICSTATASRENEVTGMLYLGCSHFGWG